MTPRQTFLTGENSPPPARSSGGSSWLEHAGSVSTVLLITALEIAAWRHFHIPNPPALLVLTVVFSAFAGSFRAGLISAGLAWIYFCHALGEPGRALDFNPENFRQLLVWSLVLPLLVLMVGLLRRHALHQAARRLQEIEERFRLLAGTLEDQALLSLDREGRVRSWNFGAGRIHGWRAEEITGQPIARLYAPEDVAVGLPERDLAKSAAEGRLELEGERTRKDGSLFRARVILTALQNEKGKLRGYLMRVRDLTRSTPAEAALLDRAHQQVAVAALGQSALVGIDPQTLMDHAAMFVMQTLRVEFCDILELQAGGKSLLLKSGAGWQEGVIGHATVAVTPDSMAAYTLQSAEPVIVKDLAAITHFQVPPFLRDHGVHSSISLIIPGADGPLGLLEAHTTGARKFNEDDFHFLQGVANVLATAHARKCAETENEHLAAFAQFNPNPMLEFAADGTLTYFNRATRRMIEVLQKNQPEEILPPETRALIHECLEQNTNRLGLETTLSARTISWSFFPIPAIHRVHVYAVDITERLSLEAQFRQSQKMEAIGQLAAGVAHDFNNLLTIMQGNVVRLLGKDPVASQIEPLRQVLTATDRAASMTRQLLAFGRRQVMQPCPLDLHEIVGQMTKMLERLIGEETSLRVEKSGALPPVFADPAMMEQILLNFVVNARDAMPPGGGEIIVRAAATEVDAAHAALHPGARPGAFVCLSVTDTGSGMDEATRARIFEPFFTTKAVGKGTGLGLATVFGIVQQHEGWIEVESAPGHGSTFSVFLPVTQQAIPGAPSAEETPATPATGGQETILLVEDEPVLRELAKAILTDAGYTILEADEGVSALAQWRQHRETIDLLLTDMVLPGGLSGRELADMIHPEKSALKVLFTTGYSPDQFGEDSGLRAGLNFLQKPYHPPTLIQVVRACLDAK